MKITYSREEIEQIILSHANATAPKSPISLYSHRFNTVSACNYQSMPREVEVSYVDTKASGENPNEAQ